MNAAVAVLGGLSVLLILFRIIDPPSFGSFGGVSVDATLSIGIFLGLIAAAGIAYGGYSAMQEEGHHLRRHRRPALRRRHPASAQRPAPAPRRHRLEQRQPASAATAVERHAPRHRRHPRLRQRQ